MMIAAERNRFITTLIHILLWVLFGLLLLFYLPFTWGGRLPQEFWLKQTIVFVVLAGIYYLNSFVIVPKVLLKNRLGLFILLIVLIAVFVTWFIQSAEKLMHLQELMEQSRRQHYAESKSARPAIDMFTLLMTFLVIGISTSVTAIQNWQRDARERQLLQQQKVSSELSYLKAQINPHFFFNTLNNIYSLTHIDIESSRDALHKLSRMMRYVLYETQTPTIVLSKEIAFIRDYIELMKLRLTSNVRVRFEAPALTQDPEIAPMLLLPFIENAFKHGVSALQPGNIDINIWLEGQSLTVDVRNTVYSEKRVVTEEGNGIGMNNTRRRLALLYPGRHKLETEEDNHNGEFRVHLNIDLA